MNYLQELQELQDCDFRKDFSNETTGRVIAIFGKDFQQRIRKLKKHKTCKYKEAFSIVIDNNVYMRKNTKHIVKKKRKKL